MLSRHPSALRRCRLRLGWLLERRCPAEIDAGAAALLHVSAPLQVEDALEVTGFPLDADTANERAIATIKRLHELLGAGAISAEAYRKKVAQLMDSIQRRS